MTLRIAALLLLCASMCAGAEARPICLDQYPGALALSDTDLTLVEQGGQFPAKQVSLAAVKAYLLGSASPSGGSSNTGSGPSDRIDQLGAAATLGNTDITIVEQGLLLPSAQPCAAATKQITLASLQQYLSVPLTEFLAVNGTGLLVDSSGRFVSGP